MVIVLLSAIHVVPCCCVGKGSCDVYLPKMLTVKMFFHYCERKTGIRAIEVLPLKYWINNVLYLQQINIHTFLTMKMQQLSFYQ